MSREIKFRIWHKEEKRMFNPELIINDNTVPDFLSVMQYTGLKDKNGVEIYEGDIVSGHIFGKCEVRYYKNSFVIWSIYGDFSRGYVGDNLEVIGNIYENTELLEV